MPLFYHLSSNSKHLFYPNNYSILTNNHQNTPLIHYSILFSFSPYSLTSPHPFLQPSQHSNILMSSYISPYSSPSMTTNIPYFSFTLFYPIFLYFYLFTKMTLNHCPYSPLPNILKYYHFSHLKIHSFSLLNSLISQSTLTFYYDQNHPH